MIHYTRIIWEDVAFIWKVTGKAVAMFMTGTVAAVINIENTSMHRCESRNIENLLIIYSTY